MPVAGHPRKIEINSKFDLDLIKKGLILHPQNSNDSVAQPVEHMPFKHRVLGSNPSGITLKKASQKREAFFIINNFIFKN